MSPATRHFVRHYVEMLIAMFAGMVVLGAAAVWVLELAGVRWEALSDDVPALLLLGMATTMTVPMVGWMRYRGHGRRTNAEMAAAMYLPTFGVIALLWAGVMTDLGALMMVEHVVMLLAMLGAMLLRPREYACRPGRRHAARAQQEVTA